MSAAELADEQVRQQLIPALHKLKGRGTLGDIVAAAGTPARKTANLLNRLLVEWGGTLAVDERGELLYKFPPSLSPPFKWQEIFWATTEAAYRVFKVAFKICIAIVLVLYFVVFLVIMIAMILAALAALFKDSDGPDFDLDLGGGFPNVFVWFVGDWGSAAPQPRKQTRWQRNQGLTAYKEKSRTRPVYELVFNYVFGEEPPAAAPAAADREILAYIREHKGVIAATDLVFLRGCNYDDAERLATRLLVDYNGEPEVSEEGTILYRFSQLVRSAAQDSTGLRAWNYWWESSEPPAVLNQNGTVTNGVITGFNIFNLGWSGWFALAPGSTLQVAGLFGGTAAPPAMGFLLGWFPFLFSMVFFAVPVLRWWALQQENERRVRRNRRRVLLKTTAQTVQAGKLDLPSLPAAKDDLTELVLAYKGDVQIGEQGNVLYRFERMRRELADSDEARKGVQAADLKLGQIVYDTARSVQEP